MRKCKDRKEAFPPAEVFGKVLKKKVAALNFLF
jgi:hypothetical protein